MIVVFFLGLGIVVLASSVCPLKNEFKSPVEACYWEGLALGKPDSCSGGHGNA